MKDKKLEELLLEQYEHRDVVSDKTIKRLFVPRFTSGKLIKYGDMALVINEILNTLPSEIKIDVRTISLELSEIDLYCRNYIYVLGEWSNIYVVKNPSR